MTAELSSAFERALRRLRRHLGSHLLRYDPQSAMSAFPAAGPCSRILFLGDAEFAYSVLAVDERLFRRTDVFIATGFPCDDRIAMLARWAVHRGLDAGYVGDLSPVGLATFLAMRLGFAEHGATLNWTAPTLEWIEQCDRASVTRRSMTDQTRFDARLLIEMKKLPFDWAAHIDPDLMDRLDYGDKFCLSEVCDLRRIPDPRSLMRTIALGLARGGRRR